MFLLVITSAGCHSKERHPAVAGRFYPGEAAALRNTVSQLIDAVPDDIRAAGDVMGLVLPHAGYVYSGQVAAYGIKLIEKKQYDTVIIIGQSHNALLTKAAVDTTAAYRTPLGSVPVDRMLAYEIIRSNPHIEANAAAHIPEHSLEVEIPFLQVALGTFKIVPILVGSFSVKTYKGIAESIARAVEKHGRRNVLYVISTDMSHYPSWKDACVVDKSMLQALAMYDPLVFKKRAEVLVQKEYENLSCVFCGEGAVITGMYLTGIAGADSTQVLCYANSGDVSGDKSRVVGYCAAAFIRKHEETGIQREETVGEFSVSEKNQKVLLELARNTISGYLATKKIPEYATDDPELLNKAAVFVTLQVNHQLRGCIGTTAPQLSLYQAVQQYAIAAAVEDYRFKPVTEKELKDIAIEISVLSPMTRVKDADEVKQDVHGVIVRGKGRSGLFLPQVWEHFSKKEDFLSELCSQKAGLSRDAWKDPETEMYIFTVFAFEER